MKASNFTTPRSLDECQFFPAADPIERHYRPPHRSSGWVGFAVFAVIALAALSLAIIAGV